MFCQVQALVSGESPIDNRDMFCIICAMRAAKATWLKTAPVHCQYSLVSMETMRKQKTTRPTYECIFSWWESWMAKRTTEYLHSRCTLNIIIKHPITVHVALKLLGTTSALDDMYMKISPWKLGLGYFIINMSHQKPGYLL